MFGETPNGSARTFLPHTLIVLQLLHFDTPGSSHRYCGLRCATMPSRFVVCSCSSKHLKSSPGYYEEFSWLLSHHMIVSSSIIKPYHTIRSPSTVFFVALVPSRHLVVSERYHVDNISGPKIRSQGLESGDLSPDVLLFIFHMNIWIATRPSSASPIARCIASCSIHTRHDKRSSHSDALQFPIPFQMQLDFVLTLLSIHHGVSLHSFKHVWPPKKSIVVLYPC